MTEPKRIQRKRTKGWRMPEGAVYVGRPTIFGNPFRPMRIDGEWMAVDDNGVDYQPYFNAELWARRKAVELFESEVTYWAGGRIKHDPVFREAVESLRGRDLACWCSPLNPCHADVLLALANPTPTTRRETEPETDQPKEGER